MGARSSVAGILALALVVSIGHASAAKPPSRKAVAVKPPPKVASDALTKSLDSAHAAVARLEQDRFANVGPPAAAGEPFLKVLPVKDSQAAGISVTDAWWSYRDGTLAMHLMLSQSTLSAVPDLQTSMIGGRQLKVQSYAGQNAFGAGTNVDIEDWRIDQVAFLDRPVSGGTSYDASIDVTGEAARKLSRNVRLVIEGVTAAMPGKGVTTCWRRAGNAPTIDRPYQIIRHNCVVGVKVSRIAFVDVSDNRTLKEWVQADR